MTTDIKPVDIVAVNIYPPHLGFVAGGVLYVKVLMVTLGTVIQLKWNLGTVSGYNKTSFLVQIKFITEDSK